jgi:hypothetical protein
MPVQSVETGMDWPVFAPATFSHRLRSVYSIPLTCRGISYRDARGEWWCVTEQPHPTEPSSRCLVFMSAGAARRVCTYPSGWRLLAAGELEALSWGR